jgi:cytochrome c oxidase subunit II
VFVLVEGLLVYAVFRYRRQSDNDEEPEQIHGNATLEILWTIVPAGIMVVLFVLTLQTLQAQQTIPDNAYTIQVIGHRWFWEFRYPEGPIETKMVHIPAGRPVVFELTSQDVIHSFWVPQLGGKLDAIPGRVNTTWLEANKPGIFAGECAEFCGREHYAMLFDVEAMSQSKFDDWMKQKIAEMGSVVCKEAPCAPEEMPDVATLPAGNAENGAQLYDAKACKGCHSLDGSALVGPSFKGLSTRAEGRTPDETAQEYIEHSILRPCDIVVTGFTCQMPLTFGQQLNPQQLSDLIAYLMEQ